VPQRHSDAARQKGRMGDKADVGALSRGGEAKAFRGGPAAQTPTKEKRDRGMEGGRNKTRQ